MSITIEEIARKANVSKATVSRVLNNRAEGVGPETRARVAELLQSSGYVKNRGGGDGQTKTLGLILPDITNPFFAELAKSVENCASENGYTVILGNSDFSAEKEEANILTFVSKRVDGVILISTCNKCGQKHRMFERYKVPCVLLDRSLPLAATASVSTDNEQAMFNVCELLIGHGTRQIAFISGPTELSTAQERVVGYKRALQEHGIPVNRALILYGDYTVESGYNAVMQMERAGLEYHGIIASNDMMALGAMQALREMSYRIPEDVEVVGFDNISYSLLCDPKLTTVQQPTAEMGRRATRLLLDAIKGKSIAEPTVRLQARLILRKSTK